LEQLKNGIEEFKNKGFESEEITLSYKRQTDVKKSML
jgi:hypothetical protein